MTHLNMFRRFAIVTAVVSVGMLTACADKSEPTGGGKQPDIATIAGKGPATSAPSAAGERPLLRPDASAEEKERLYQLWEDCRKANGAKMMTVDGREIVDKRAPESEQASEKCANKFPEEIWQRAERTDPLYEDKLRAWVKCVQSHGIKAKADGRFLSYEEGLPSDAQQTFVDQCQSDAFGKG
jgi:hypothetical protein